MSGVDDWWVSKGVCGMFDGVSESCLRGIWGPGGCPMLNKH